MINSDHVFVFIAVNSLIALFIGYVFGSVPFGLIFSKAAGLGDIRSIGSGNIGATNVLRTGHRGIAALTLIFDALKGTAAVFIAMFLLGAGIERYTAAAAAAGAVIGHVFPVWLKLKGGKGVATFLGVTLGISPPAACLFVTVWAITAIVSRYSSLSAILASAFTSIFIFATHQHETGVLFLALAMLLLWKHKQNIQRLLNGTESKIGSKP